jgi:hypothetical protein
MSKRTAEEVLGEVQELLSAKGGGTEETRHTQNIYIQNPKRTAKAEEAEGEVQELLSAKGVGMEETRHTQNIYIQNPKRTA